MPRALGQALEGQRTEISDVQARGSLLNPKAPKIEKKFT